MPPPPPLASSLTTCSVWPQLLEEAIKDDPTQMDKVNAWTPLGRGSQPGEIAACIAFLCMPAAGYISGEMERHCARKPAFH